MVGLSDWVLLMFFLSQYPMKSMVQVTFFWFYTPISWTFLEPLDFWDWDFRLSSYWMVENPWFPVKMIWKCWVKATSKCVTGGYTPFKSHVVPEGVSSNVAGKSAIFFVDFPAIYKPPLIRDFPAGHVWLRDKRMFLSQGKPIKTHKTHKKKRETASLGSFPRSTSPHLRRNQPGIAKWFHPRLPRKNGSPQVTSWTMEFAKFPGFHVKKCQIIPDYTSIGFL